jgi:hypothetical protein
MTKAALVQAAQPDRAKNLSLEIPAIEAPLVGDFQLLPNVAQYKGADWSNVVGISRGISRDEACRIAENNPDITYFFYVKGIQMVLETEDGDYRVFQHGDAVFFTGTPWWGSAEDLADGYVKNSSKQ